jgi:hypothetical protein
MNYRGTSSVDPAALESGAGKTVAAELEIRGNLCPRFLPGTVPRQHCARGCACFRAEAVWDISLGDPDLAIPPFPGPLR